MTCVDTQWALKAILQLGHEHLRQRAATSLSSSTTIASSLFSSPKVLHVAAMPRLMQTPDASRTLLLAKRTNGIVGVELSVRRRVPWAVPPSASIKSTKKARLLAAYLQGRGFHTASPASSLHLPPLLLHTNHLIAWKLNNEAAAFPLYAHSFSELQRLRRRDVAALQPRDCLLADAYCEWDNWREVLGEPGWDFFGADDEVVERILRSGLDAPLREDDAEGGSVCKVVLP